MKKIKTDQNKLIELMDNFHMVLAVCGLKQIKWYPNGYSKERKYYTVEQNNEVIKSTDIFIEAIQFFDNL